MTDWTPKYKVAGFDWVDLENAFCKNGSCEMEEIARDLVMLFNKPHIKIVSRCKKCVRIEFENFATDLPRMTLKPTLVEIQELLSPKPKQLDYFGSSTENLAHFLLQENEMSLPLIKHKLQEGYILAITNYPPEHPNANKVWQAALMSKDRERPKDFTVNASLAQRFIETSAEIEPINSDINFGDKTTQCYGLRSGE